MWGTPQLKKIYGSQSMLNVSFQVLTSCQEPFQSPDQYGKFPDLCPTDCAPMEHREATHSMDEHLVQLLRRRIQVNSNFKEMQRKWNYWRQFLLLTISITRKFCKNMSRLPTSYPDSSLSKTSGWEQP